MKPARRLKSRNTFCEVAKICVQFLSFRGRGVHLAFESLRRPAAHMGDCSSRFAAAGLDHLRLRRGFIGAASGDERAQATIWAEQFQRDGLATLQRQPNNSVYAQTARNRFAPTCVGAISSQPINLCVNLPWSLSAPAFVQRRLAQVSGIWPRFVGREYLAACRFGPKRFINGFAAARGQST